VQLDGCSFFITSGLRDHPICTFQHVKRCVSSDTYDSSWTFDRSAYYCVAVLWVVAALRMFTVIAQPGELVVEGLDRGFFLAECFLDEFVALCFESLLIGEKFIDRVVSHTV
jgi:hypothetical protein